MLALSVALHALSLQCFLDRDGIEVDIIRAFMGELEYALVAKVLNFGLRGRNIVLY